MNKLGLCDICCKKVSLRQLGFYSLSVLEDQNYSGGTRYLVISFPKPWGQSYAVPVMVRGSNVPGEIVDVRQVGRDVTGIKKRDQNSEPLIVFCN